MHVLCLGLILLGVREKRLESKSGLHHISYRRNKAVSQVLVFWDNFYFWHLSGRQPQVPLKASPTESFLASAAAKRTNVGSDRLHMTSVRLYYWAYDDYASTHAQYALQQQLKTTNKPKYGRCVDTSAENAQRNVCRALRIPNLASTRQWGSCSWANRFTSEGKGPRLTI